MAFTAETIYVTLEGGTVLPITDVTDEKVASNVVIYDGETYRNLFDAADLGRAWSTNVYQPYATGTATPASTAEAKDDRVTGTAPIYKGKQRTLWSFTRAGKFTHVVWADLVQGTSPRAPYRIGMTPTSVA